MSSDGVGVVTGEGKVEQGLVPRLRFPEFRDAGVWSTEKVGNLTTPITPPKKLPTSLYGTAGKFAIIDQSQDLVCGWTDDPYAVINKGYPLIVFGDHTCVLKFVDFPFAQGADGIKILCANSKVSVTFLYQSLLNNPVTMEDYRRHFSILKERPVNFPDVKSGEQQKIADCLSSLDAVIAAEGERLALLRTHKEGLMQALFPAPGQTTPGRRFPEFQDAGDWGWVALGEIAIVHKGKGISKADIAADGQRPCIRYGELYTTYGEVIDAVVSRTNMAATELFLSRANDVIIPASGETKLDIATAACVMHDDVALGGDLNVIRTAQNGVFLSYFLNGPLKYEIAKVAQGDSVVHLYPAQIGLLKVALPDIREQQRIADCLHSVDASAASCLRVLGALRTHKSALMQQLFPSPRDAGA